MSGSHFYADLVSLDPDDGVAYVAVNGSSGEQVAHFAHLNDAHQLAALLEALASGAWPEDVLLGEGKHRRFLRRIELRHPAVCFRCGRRMEPGSAAFWHPVSRAVRHVGACSRAQLSAGRRRAA